MEVFSTDNVSFMKNKELYLPADLWPLILSKLPVKSLLRCRPVSKSWLSLIDDPEFARLHLKSFKNNRNETHFFVVQGEEKQCVVRRSDTFETDSAVLLTLGQWSDASSWSFVCSIDGLVVIKRISSKDDRSPCDLRVWNPSIKKFHEVPPLHVDESPCDIMEDSEIGLGYDPVLNDYKYVKFVSVGSFDRCPDDGTLHALAVYTLGASTWKIIPFQCKGCSEWLWEPYGSVQSVYFRGSLYFIGGRSDPCFEVDLVSFDLSTETFSYTTYPEEFMSWVSRPRVVLIDHGSTLAVTSNFRCVWAFEKSGEDDSVCWTRRCEFNVYSATHFLDVKRNHHLITEEEWIVWQNECYCWVHGGSEIRNVCGYVESLVMLK